MYKVSSSSVGSKGRVSSRTEIQTMGEVEEAKVEGVVVTAVSVAVALVWSPVDASREASD
jgi:hypothetical protein